MKFQACYRPRIIYKLITRDLIRRYLLNYCLASFYLPYMRTHAVILKGLIVLEGNVRKDEIFMISFVNHLH